MKKNYNNVSFYLGVLLISVVFLTGCWSGKDIEKKNLVTGLALDKGKKSLTEVCLEQRESNTSNNNKLTVTFQFVNSEAGATSNKTNGQQKPYQNVSETGDSVHFISREITLRRKGTPTFSHIKVIVINEDLLRLYSLEPLLDLLFRDNELRASCLVFVSKGLARKVFESEVTGGSPSLQLMEIIDNSSRSTRILPPLTVGKLTGKMESKSSFLIQNLHSADGEIKFTGGSIIKGKNKKIIGYFNEREIEGVTWITGHGKGGLVKTFDKKTNKPIVYEIKSMKSRITPQIKGNHISFDLKIESEGRLSENWLTSPQKMTNKFLNKVETIAEKEVTHLVKNVLEKAQKEYQVDVFGFRDQMRIEYPKEWEKLKNDWDKTFSKASIKCTVNLTIKDYGGER